MKSTAPNPMSVADYLAWCEAQPGEMRYELVDGEIIAQSPQRTRHAEVKFAVASALSKGIKQAQLDCHMLPDGMTVKIDEQTAYEPDALVYCGSKLDDDAILVPEPMIVVEALSPGTAHVDLGAKLIGYFTLASVQHYLIVDCERRSVIHHARGEDGNIVTRIIGEVEITLDPPGLHVSLADVFEPS